MDSFAVPKAVTNLTAADVNTTAVRLTWRRQDDHKPDYSYRVTVLEKDNKIQQLNTTTESYTVTGLTPGVIYTSQVATDVQGVKSTEESITFYTSMPLKLPLSLSSKGCPRFCHFRLLAHGGEPNAEIRLGIGAKQSFITWNHADRKIKINRKRGRN